MRNTYFAGYSLPALAFLALTLVAIFSFQAVAFASTAQCDPQVAQTAPQAYWSSYNDYLERRLTVDENLQNTGGCVPCQLRIAQVEASQGVSIETPLPIDLGDIPQAASGNVRLKFMVPAGVDSFYSRIKVVCAPAPPQPVSSPQFTIEPPLAWANEGCPVAPPELDGLELPTDQQYGARLFTATLKDEGGSPVAGKAVKWRLSDPFGFRIIESSGVTDAAGQATALVTPPQYFVCIVPYFDRGITKVTATTDDGLQANATFAYSRCAPVGATPPWAGTGAGI
ncbi:MAG: Ig-like domain-containing protein [Actinobacteria bacterium]|nr:Ig-like domain-containing protein [Actinomycetota bacterium]